MYVQYIYIHTYNTCVHILHLVGGRKGSSIAHRKFRGTRNRILDKVRNVTFVSGNLEQSNNPPREEIYIYIYIVIPACHPLRGRRSDIN